MLNLVCYNPANMDLWFSGTYTSIFMAIGDLICRNLNTPIVFEQMGEDKVLVSVGGVNLVLEKAEDLSTSKQEPEIYIGNH